MGPNRNPRWSKGGLRVTLSYLVYNIFNNKCLDYMHKNFTKKWSSHSTRSSSMNFNIPSIKGCESTTFYYSGIKDWNSLSESVKNCNNKNRFKTNGKKYLMEKLKKNSYQSEFILYRYFTGTCFIQKMYALSSSYLRKRRGHIFFEWNKCLRDISCLGGVFPRLNFPRHSARKFFVSRLVFFANTPPKHDISV